MAIAMCDQTSIDKKHRSMFNTCLSTDFIDDRLQHGIDFDQVIAEHHERVQGANLREPQKLDMRDTPELGHNLLLACKDDHAAYLIHNIQR